MPWNIIFHRVARENKEYHRHSKVTNDHRDEHAKHTQ